MTLIKAALISEIRAAQWAFYVYVLMKPDGIPFYVGCGGTSTSRRNHRLFDHENQAKAGRKSLKCSMIRQIWESGGSVMYAIDSWHQSSDAMFRREVELISCMGRRDVETGILANGNDGGSGMFNPSNATREKMRDAHVRRWTPEQREAQRQRVLEQHRKDPTLRARIGVSQEGRWTKEARAKQAERSKSNIQTPEVREINRMARLARFADPAVRAAHSEAARIRGSDPEIKRRTSEAVKRLWENPEYRQRVLETRRKTFAVRKSTDANRVVA